MPPVQLQRLTAATLLRAMEQWWPSKMSMTQFTSHESLTVSETDNQGPFCHQTRPDLDDGDGVMSHEV